MYTSNTHTCIHTWWTIHGCTMPSDIHHLPLGCFELVVENRLFGTTHTNYMHESSIVLPHYTSSLCSSTYCRRYNRQFSNHAFTWLIKLAHIAQATYRMHTKVRIARNTQAAMRTAIIVPTPTPTATGAMRGAAVSDISGISLSVEVNTAYPKQSTQGIKKLLILILYCVLADLLHLLLYLCQLLFLHSPGLCSECLAIVQ